MLSVNSCGKTFFEKWEPLDCFYFLHNFPFLFKKELNIFLLNVYLNGYKIKNKITVKTVR